MRCSLNLKKIAASKRAALPRSTDYTKALPKDWKQLSNSGCYDMKQLVEAMLLLIANDAPLAPEWKDHALHGQWAGHRECHIGGDFLLIYKIDDDGPIGHIVFVRTGTHADLFE